jgi:hypothetical protein
MVIEVDSLVGREKSFWLFDILPQSLAIRHFSHFTLTSVQNIRTGKPLTICEVRALALVGGNRAAP